MNSRLHPSPESLSGTRLPPLKINVIAAGGILVHTINVPDPREPIAAAFNANPAHAGCVAVPVNAAPRCRTVKGGDA